MEFTIYLLIAAIPENPKGIISTNLFPLFSANETNCQMSSAS